MKHLAVLFAGLAISTTAVQAQTAASGVPESHRPPPGMCRIWIDGVPPTHQPAPTDCATAIRKRPMNARVVFGSDAPAGSARTFAPMQPAPSNFAPSQAQSPREEQPRVVQQHEEQEKRNTRPPPPPPPAAPPTQHAPEHTAPPRTHVEKAPRPPRQSYSQHRPR